MTKIIKGAIGLISGGAIGGAAIQQVEGATDVETALYAVGAAVVGLVIAILQDKGLLKRKAK